MSQNFRLNKAGYINRDKKISFKFNGKKYFGYQGDTLASALLANGVHLIGRSFKDQDSLRRGRNLGGEWGARWGTGLHQAAVWVRSGL